MVLWISCIVRRASGFWSLGFCRLPKMTGILDVLDALHFLEFLNLQDFLNTSVFSEFSGCFDFQDLLDFWDFGGHGLMHTQLP